MTPDAESGSVKMGGEAQEIVLNKLAIAMQRAFSSEMLMGVETKVLEGRAFEETRVMVRGYIWKEKLVYVRYPKDWVQAIKDRFLPKWLKRRFPVKYVEIDGRAYYPQLSRIHPNDESYVSIRHFEVTNV